MPLHSTRTAQTPDTGIQLSESGVGRVESGEWSRGSGDGAEVGADVGAEVVADDGAEVGADVGAEVGAEVGAGNGASRESGAG